MRPAFKRPRAELSYAAIMGLALALTGCASTGAPVGAGPPARDVGFLLVGDTGYVTEPGKSGMMPVARAMHSYCQTNECAFGIMTGDNIYPDGAAADERDGELFRTRFTEPFGDFSSLSPHFRFYVTLGNHDWHTSRAGALAQVAFHERARPFFMKNLFYSVRPPGLGDQVEIFVIDTEMLLAERELPRMKSTPDGAMIPSGQVERGGGANALPQTKAEKGQLQWLSRALRSSRAKWKLVIGHHPLWQSRADSKYAQSIALREMLLPMLCREADAYLAGHQHTLELQADTCATSGAERPAEPLPNVVSGAGSKARQTNDAFAQWQQAQWPQLRQIWATGAQWGFAHLTLAGDQMTVRMIAVSETGAPQEAFRYTFNDRR